MTISINRTDRHATLSMPGYIKKLLQKVRPQGVKGAQTPAIYHAPNYRSPKAQTATVNTAPIASPAQKHELQAVVGTLLYYGCA